MLIKVDKTWLDPERIVELFIDTDKNLRVRYDCVEIAVTVVNNICDEDYLDKVARQINNALPGMKPTVYR